jgi:hypothetical protein
MALSTKPINTEEIVLGRRLRKIIAFSFSKIGHKGVQKFTQWSVVPKVINTNMFLLERQSRKKIYFSVFLKLGTGWPD